MATFFMNLTLPEQRITSATTWATQINTALTTIDAHDHTSTKGQRLIPAGININADLTFNGFSATNVAEIKFGPKTETNNSVFVSLGDLFFQDGSANDVQLTSGGAIDISGLGGINGDYSSSTAALIYSDTTKKYSFYDSAANLATVRVLDVTCETITSTGATFGTTLNQDGAATLAATTITGTTTVSGAASLTGNVSGRGIIPVGAVVGLASNLAGVSIPTGFLELNGQVISDAGSPMNGVTLPNVSGSRFIMGNATAGTLGGAANYTLLSTNIPSHTHTIDHGHSDTFALSNATVASSTHTHNIAHTHLYIAPEQTVPSDLDLYTLSSTNISKTNITTSDTIAFDSRTISMQFGSGTSSFADTGSGFDYYATGVLSPPTGSDGSTAASDTPSATQTVTLSGSVTNHTGNSGSTGSASPTAVSLLPSYITTKYIIRYK